MKPKQSITKKSPNKKKKYSKNSSALTILLILITLYLAINSIQIFRKRVQVDTVKLGKIENKIHTEAIIVRNEKVIYSPAEGYINIRAQEGIKLAKDYEALSISTSKNTSKISSKIDILNQQIYEIQKLRKNVSTVKTDVEKIDTDIQNYVSEIKKFISVKDYKSIYLYKQKLENTMEQKNEKFQTDPTTDTNLSAILEQKNKYQNELNNLSKVVYTPIPGIISYQSDGLEEKLLPDQMEDIDIFEVLEKNQPHATRLDEQVQQDKFLFRLIDPYQWFIVLKLNSGDKKIKKGDFVKVRFNDKQLVLTGSIISVKESDSSKNITIAFSSEIGKFLNERKLDIDLILEDYEGLKVPSESIVEKNFLKIPKTALTDYNYSKAIVAYKNKSKLPIPIGYYIEENDWIYIPIDIENIGINDIILKDQTNSEETFTIQEMIIKKGVYVLSAGVSQFKTVQPIISNDLYTIVKPGDYKGIQLYDQVIINPSTITDQHIIER